jgi:opacity protein-like surface antigen
MKRLTLFVFILLSTTFIYSQSNTWSFGVIGSPNFYLIKARQGSASYTTKLGLTIGAESIYSLNMRLDLGLGVSIKSLGYQVDYNYTFLEPNDPFIPKYGEVRSFYMDIPIFIRVNLFLGARITFFPSAAINSSFLINSRERITYEDNSIQERNNLRTYLLSLQVGLGVAYKINQKVSIKLEPRIRSYWEGFDKVTSTRPPTLFQTVIGLEYKIGKKDLTQQKYVKLQN